MQPIQLHWVSCLEVPYDGTGESNTPQSYRQDAPLLSCKVGGRDMACPRTSEPLDNLQAFSLPISLPERGMASQRVAERLIYKSSLSPPGSTDRWRRRDVGYPTVSKMLVSLPLFSPAISMRQRDVDRSRARAKVKWLRTLHGEGTAIWRWHFLA